MPPRDKPPPPRNPARKCPVCGHVLVDAVTDHGLAVTLDTQLSATWVISGRESQEGYPIVVPSRGYVVHDHVCRGGA